MPKGKRIFADSTSPNPLKRPTSKRCTDQEAPSVDPVPRAAQRRHADFFLQDHPCPSLTAPCLAHSLMLCIQQPARRFYPPSPSRTHGPGGRGSRAWPRPRLHATNTGMGSNAECHPLAFLNPPPLVQKGDQRAGLTPPLPPLQRAHMCHATFSITRTVVR